MMYIMYSVKSALQKEHPSESHAKQAAQHRQQIWTSAALAFDLRALAVFN
jgi:hypothetical protein